MSSIEKENPTTPAPVASEYERPEPTPRVHEQNALLKALLNHINPYCDDEEREHVLKALHHETGGSDDGQALADYWLSKGDSHPGEAELRDIWRALADDPENPTTFDTLREMVANNSFDVDEICGRVDAEAAPTESTVTNTDEQTTDTAAEPATLLDRYSLKGMRESLLRDAVKQEPALDPLALMGQATAIFGQSNIGKSLIIQYLAANAASLGLIDPARLFYINADDSQAGVLEKLEYADEFGFHTIAEGHQGFSADQLQKILDDLTVNNQAKRVIIILDTGKKFYDPMSKREGRKFGKYIRRFVINGGTVIVLAHTNKNRDSEGKPIYAGTTDIVEDFDCAHLLYEVAVDVDTETRTIQFENIKNRGKVARQVAYRYSIAEGLSYREILDSVKPVDDDDVSSLKQAVVLEADTKVIDAITQCIQGGMDVKMRLAEATAKQADVSKRTALKILDKYCGSDPDKHRWDFKVHERGAKKYYLLNTITTGTDSVS